MKGWRECCMTDLLNPVITFSHCLMTLAHEREMFELTREENREIRIREEERKRRGDQLSAGMTESKGRKGKERKGRIEYEHIR